MLGQTVNSYRDPSPRRMSFAELLVAVAEVPGIRRVRFMTSHPRDLGADIVAAMDSVPAICEHVHLPVQSGSTRILARHAARLHARGVSREARAGPRRAAAPSASPPTSSSAFPARPRAISRKPELARSGAVRRRLLPFSIRRGRTRRRVPCPTRLPEEEKSRRLRVLQERQRAIQDGAQPGADRQASSKCLSRAQPAAKMQWSGRTSSNRMLNFTSPR